MKFIEHIIFKDHGYVFNSVHDIWKYANLLGGRPSFSLYFCEGEKNVPDIFFINSHFPLDI